MEETWVRQSEALPADLDEIGRLIADTGLRPVGAVSLSGGKANSNYRLEMESGGPCLLRIYQRAPEVQGLELALLRAFAGRLPVPDIIGVGDGWVVEQLLPGRTLQRAAAAGAANEIERAAFGIGLALATIADTAFPKAGFLSEDLTVKEAWPSVTGGLDAFLEVGFSRPQLADRIGLPMISKVEVAWQRARDRVADVAAEPNLSHGDFKPSNLLIDDGRLSGVLDWEFAHAGTWLLDAGQIVRHRGELPPDFCGDVERGLWEGGIEVPEDWLRLAGAVDLLSLVDFLGRDQCAESTVSHIGRLIAGTLDLWL